MPERTTRGGHHPETLTTATTTTTTEVLATSSSVRPPTSVYTRGTMGAVKTNTSSSSNNHRKGTTTTATVTTTSMTTRSQQQQSASSSSSPHPHNPANPHHQQQQQQHRVNPAWSSSSSTRRGSGTEGGGGRRSRSQSRDDRANPRRRSTSAQPTHGQFYAPHRNGDNHVMSRQQQHQYQQHLRQPQHNQHSQLHHHHHPQGTSASSSRANSDSGSACRGMQHPDGSSSSEHGDHGSVNSAPSFSRKSYFSSDTNSLQGGGSSAASRTRDGSVVRDRQRQPRRPSNQQQQQRRGRSRSSSVKRPPNTPPSNRRHPPTSSSTAAVQDTQEALKQHGRMACRVIDDLNRAQGTERRIAAITNACESFDHADEGKHNIELYHGAAHALAKLLGHNDDENRMVCSALEMVFRASSKSVETAYDRIGTSLITRLLRLLDRCETGNIKHADVSVLNISRILCHLSRCGTSFRSSLCRHPGTLPALSRIATTTNAESRQARTRMIANLSNCEDNKVLLFEHEGLVDALLRIAHYDTAEATRQYAGCALMELASSPNNQVAMARQDRVLGTLVKMVLVEKSAVTRDYVITAIQNLAFAKENRRRLVDFKQGIVLEALKKSLTTDPDAKARRRAAGALTNLACDETAETMGNHKGLLTALAIVATKDDSVEVQTRAALALSKIAGSVTVRMECHSVLLDALVVASLSKASNSISGVLRVKAREPENRESLALHPGILDTLADICVSSSSGSSTLAVDRDNAVRAMMHLVNESKNRKIMCTKSILDALVTAANYKDSDLMEARDSAVRAMQRLATEVSNRSVMAHHEGLLIAVAKAVEREDRWETAGRESEHGGYLSKALLMSLLVAL